ncbi:MAG: alpha-L-arabinofuranosidase C-terminal domain-containing protein [Verrucomicrobiota bacterium]
MKTNLRSQLLSLSLAALATTSIASAATVTIQADKPGHQIPPTLWGVFFEDINLSADGGIYPEQVRNRSFEDSDKLENWTFAKIGDGASEATIDTSRPLHPLNKRSLRIKLDGAVTLENNGYYGMGIAKGATYTFKAALRGDNFSGPLVIKILSNDGRELASGEIRYIGESWKYQSIELTAVDSDAKAKLQILASSKGTVFLDMVSLLPKKTWKNNGLRPDLAEAVDALKPTVFRFPGGCWVEGETMEKMYNWKKTIGNVDARTPLWNIWQYYATHGLGYHEYLQMAEDLGAEPLFCINVGMSHKEVIPMDQMGQWVQDALDALEYANGPTNSFWGGLRAKNGHPAPFNMKFLEIGNENGTQAYNERWALFHKAIKAKYPDVHLIANDWQNNIPKDPKPDLVDEHYYNTPEFFMQQAHRYDTYDRNGPKIFVGEYAVTRNTGKGNLRGAIGEAAFMTGMERNSDVVSMAAYAPLFCNANHKRWPVNLINFDSTRWFGIPSYYVQKLFSEHRGDTVLPTSVEVGTIEEKPPTGGIGVGTWNTSAEFKDIKVTAPDGKVLFTSDFSQNSAGWKLLGDGAEWSVQDGALRQTGEREFIRALAGDNSWTDYTLTLKARKISGREGFLILFHINDDEDRVWWNIGGWENTQHGMEVGDTLDGKRGHIEVNRWYDIKVEVKGGAVKCSLDGKVIHDLKNTLTVTRGLFASAVQDSKTGDIIVKVVNAATTPTETEINLNGAKKLASSASAVVLTSDSPKDENTLDEPTKVAPKNTTLSVSGTKIKSAFPGNSFTVIRVKAEK